MRKLIHSVILLFTILATANGQTNPNKQQATAAETGGNVAVLLETASWGQNYPFNNQCWTKYGGTTHAKTGCVATAYAIVLRHHK
ncbi:MAG: C10 family peptidase, partial [Bacteroidaceae bacterium]|nr:C10 family peptidase [Bacteroidaceae bacterium]